MKSTGVFDCIMFPGAIKAADNAVLLGDSLCGGNKGIASVSNGPKATICCNIPSVLSCRLTMISFHFSQSDPLQA